MDLEWVHALCNAHARRRFADATKAIKDRKVREHSKAMIAINYYKKLYAIEAQLKEERDNYTDINEGYERRLERRQAESLPIGSEMIAWIEALIYKVRPKTHFGIALKYLYRYRVGLVVFLKNGKVEIDNNCVENKIRPVAQGRHNWLFSGTENGAVASGNLYSVINTAMLNGRNPYTYLVYIFTRLPYAKTLEDLEELLPWNISPSDC